MTETNPQRRNNASKVAVLDPERLIQRRMSLGLFQKEVASRAGISAQYLADIEAGRRHGSPRVRVALAKALRTSLDKLVKEVAA